MTQHRRPRAIRTVFFAAAAAGALILAGCSGTGGGDKTGGGTQEFSFAFAVSNNVVTAYEKLAKEYMAANKDVKITLNPVPNDSYAQTLQTQLQAGNASDVFQTSPGTGQQSSIVTLAKANLLEPLDDSAAKLIPAGNEALFQVDGKTYGQALSISVASNVLNDTAAKAAGVEFPSDWSGLLEACKAAEGKGKALFVLAGAMPPNTGIMAMAIAATRVYAENPTWNQDRTDKKTTFADTPGWKDTLEAIADLNKAGCFQKGVEGAGFDAITQGMAQGTSIAMFGPSGATADLKQAAPDQDFLVETFPPADGGKAFTLASSNYSLSMAASSKHKDAVKKFLDWMAQPEQSAAFAADQGSLPVAGLDSFDFSKSVYAPVADLIKNGDYVALPNATWPNSAVYDALGAGVQGLLTGQKTVDQVLADMDTAWDQ